MKNFTQKLIPLLSLLATFNINAQCEWWEDCPPLTVSPEMFVPPLMTYNNMTVGFTSYLFTQFSTCDYDCIDELGGVDFENENIDPLYMAEGLMGAFADLDENGILECVGLNYVREGFNYITLWGDDYATPEKDGLSPNEIVQFAILHQGNVIVMEDVPQFTGYVTNGIVNITDVSLYMEGCDDPTTCNYNPNPPSDVTIIDACVGFAGCDNEDYLEYDPFATCDTDPSSCLTLKVEGCTDPTYCNFNLAANVDDGSCAGEYGCMNPDYSEYHNQGYIAGCDNQSCLVPSVYGCNYDFALNFDPLANVNDDSCEVEGCTFDWADNFDVYATINDESCYRFGCTGGWADNFDDLATEDDSSCYKYGCTEVWADNFDDLATDNDGSCYKYGCTEVWADNYGEYATIDDESCYRYGCTSNLAVNYDEYATIDNDNCDFDIITHLNMSFDVWNISIDLSSGWNMFGYGCPTSIDLAEGLSNHTDKITIVKDNNGAVYMPEFGFNGIGDLTPGYGYQIKVVEEINDFSLCDWYVNDIPEDNIVSLQDSIEVLNNEILELECVNQGACFFNNELGQCVFAESGYDCEGNVTAQIGDVIEGGYLFYLDETGQHGLVAAMEDVTEGATNPLDWSMSGYEWGCSQVNFTTAIGENIGAGYQNTLDILEQNCTSDGGGIIAAAAANNYEALGYTDWYLPSIDELIEISNTIGYNADSNIGQFQPYGYWSSSGVEDLKAWVFNFGVANGNGDGHSWRYYTALVRPIRSF